MGRFLASVEELLRAEAVCDRLASLPAEQQPTSLEVRKFRRSMKELGKGACQELRCEALRELQDVGRAALEASHATLGWFLSADVLAQLCDPGWLGEDFVLRKDGGFLREGWCLLGGLSLGSAVPDV